MFLLSKMILLDNCIEDSLGLNWGGNTGGKCPSCLRVKHSMGGLGASPPSSGEVAGCWSTGMSERLNFPKGSRTDTHNRIRLTPLEVSQWGLGIFADTISKIPLRSLHSAIRHL